MAELTRLENVKFEADITAVAMDNKFIVVGQADGKVDVVYSKNGMPKFQDVEVSGSKITAVCADDDEDYFYIGDEEGNLFVLDKKGETVNTSKMPDEVAGAVLVIMNNSGTDFSFAAYSSQGSAYFKEVTTSFSLTRNPTTHEANYSVDGDGTFYDGKDEGDNQVLSYNASTEAKVVSTVAVFESSRKYGNFHEVFSFVIADNEAYESNIQAAEKTLSVRKGLRANKTSGKEVKKLEFEAPVKQVISCRHHTGGDAEQDDIYVLLCDGDLFKFNGTKLFTDGAEVEIGDPILDYYPEDIEDEKYLGGFAVYENKVVIYGNQGLYVADV